MWTTAGHLDVRALDNGLELVVRGHALRHRAELGVVLALVPAGIRLDVSAQRCSAHLASASMADCRVAESLSTLMPLAPTRAAALLTAALPARIEPQSVNGELPQQLASSQTLHSMQQAGQPTLCVGGCGAHGRCQQFGRKCAGNKNCASDAARACWCTRGGGSASAVDGPVH